MIVYNEGKARILRVKQQDCKTPEAMNLWYELYNAQAKEDLARRKIRVQHGIKKRDLIAPKWQLDKFLRVVLGHGSTRVPDEFSELAQAALAGEISLGRMSISGLPKPPAPEVAPEVIPEVEPPPAKKKWSKKDVVSEDEAD